MLGLQRRDLYASVRCNSLKLDRFHKDKDVCLIVGIDATNLRQGGGITHLLELLAVAEPLQHGINKIVIWGDRTILATLEDRPWLVKIIPPECDLGLMRRMFWQRFKLSRAASDAGCDLLFVPGGSYAGSFAPVVTMSQNLLPFERQELRRFGLSRATVRLMLLRWMQSRSFLRSDGVIFLTNYAKNQVLSTAGKISGRITVIPHGLNPRFRIAPKPQLPLSEYSEQRPFRLIYVSIVNQYKHQWHVVEAGAKLRRAALPIVLDLVGPSYPPALVRLMDTIAHFDPEGKWVCCHGEIPYAGLHHKYNKADLGIFASSCENMPNILLETMAAGLPIACSNRGPMPEVLGDAGVYFDPEDPNDIASALRELIDSPDLRARLAKSSFERAQAFSWQRCASETFGFLAEVASTHSTSSLMTVRA